MGWWSGARVTLYALLVLLCLPAALQAQSANARQVYTEALKREAELRRDIDTHQPTDPVAPLLVRIRTLVGAYSDMSRLFPNNEQGDNALWQGAMLAADTFWRFGDEIDRATALNLLDALTSRFPSSPRTAQASPHVRRLADAGVLTPVPGFGDERPTARAAAPPVPAPSAIDAPSGDAPATARAAADPSVRETAPAAAPPTATTPAAVAAAAPPSAAPPTAPAAAAPATATADARPPAGSAPLEPRASSSPRSTAAAPPARPPVGSAAPPAAAPAGAPAAQAPIPSSGEAAAAAGGPADPTPVASPPAAPPAVATAGPSASPIERARARDPVPVPSSGVRQPAAATSATAAASRVVIPSGPARLTGISGESIGEAIRFTLAVEREVAVRHEQFGGPPRVVIDLQDTVPAETLTQALLPLGADVVSRIRVGRHDGTWTRVVIELRAPSRYGVFAAQDPYRVLVEVHPRPGALSTDARPAAGR